MAHRGYYHYLQRQQCQPLRHQRNLRQSRLLPGAGTETDKKAGNLLFVSGHGTQICGKVGGDLTTDDGYNAARECTINCLSAIKQAVGDLDKVNIVKVFGMVNCTPDYVNQPTVLNGASDLLIEVFGQEKGCHARSAIGMCSLPRGIACEVEMVVEVTE